MNFVFISPQFPQSYWNFCDRLQARGVNVLGIGDTPYDELSKELRHSLTEYYKVNSLENYDEVYRAMAFLTFKHGRIDWVESNNEYWLEQDARLRTDFNISSGFHTSDMEPIKHKSKMKEYYARVGIPTARYYLVEDLEGCRAFIEKVGYPVIAKPDNGVGAASTYKIKCEEDLLHFMGDKAEGVTYIMEEFVHATVNSYDAIIDSQGTPIFETGNVTVLALIDVVNDNDDSIFYIHKELPEDTRAAGRATVKSFGVKSRFVHLEFFRLDQDQEGLGKKGQIVALEVNMRPSGGVTPDMINFAHSTDVYKIWADMIAFDRTDLPEGEHNYCAFAGLRDSKPHTLTHDDIMARYGHCMRMVGRVPDALSGAMGNQMYVATFPTQEGVDEFYDALTH